MTTAKDSKQKLEASHARQDRQVRLTAETPKRGVVLSSSAAFLVGAAVGAAIEEAKLQGNKAHVHLSLGPEIKGCDGHDNGQDFGL